VSGLCRVFRSMQGVCHRPASADFPRWARCYMHLGEALYLSGILVILDGNPALAAIQVATCPVLFACQPSSSSHRRLVGRRR
jgi:hypothetical protein